MHKVIVLDNLAQEGLDLLDQAADIEYDVKLKLSGDELKKTLLEYDGAICRSGVTLDAAALEGNRRLKAIVRAGVGTDNIDKPTATRQGIIVMNTPTGNTLSTAEHAFALLLALSRNVAPANQSLIEGRWDRKKFMGAQVAEKVLGVVGLGRIGREVASRAQAFGMRIIGFDPFLSDERAKELGIEPVATVADMLPKIDYLTVHTPLTEETRGLIDHDALERIKPGARLVNCARGGIYDETALVDGLKSGKLAGVALDVYANEPCTDSPLFGMPGVVCTPHLGASTEEAQTNVAVEAAQLLTNFLTTGEIRYAVNTATVDPQTLDSLRGYLDTAYRLGMLMAQWHQGSSKSCQLSYRGDIAGRDTKLLTAAFCAGLLGRAMDGEVNIINAEVIMRERGIQVTAENNSEQLAFSSSITAQLETDQETYVAAGTLFGNDMPRLIRLGNYRLEAYLDGIMLMFRHDDIPGIIGSVGTSFGKHQVNIGQMSVGRADASGVAVGVLNLDTHPSSEAVAEVLAHPNVQKVQVVELPPAGELPSWLQN